MAIPKVWIWFYFEYDLPTTFAWWNIQLKCNWALFWFLIVIYDNTILGRNIVLIKLKGWMCNAVLINAILLFWQLWLYQRFMNLNLGYSKEDTFIYRERKLSQAYEGMDSVYSLSSSYKSLCVLKWDDKKTYVTI